MRVVALVPGSIGDQILFFPTLDSLKRHYPDAQIDVVVEPRSKAAYRVSKSVHEVLTFDYKDRNSLADWGNLVGTIRDREYDVAISAGESWYVGLFLWLTGIPTRIGFQGNGAGFLTNVVPVNTSQYVAAMYHDLLKPLGIKAPCPELAVNILKPDLEWAQQQQQRLGISDSGYILVYGGSGQLSQINGADTNYPVASWQQIIQSCQQKQPDLPVVVIKEAEDESFISSLVASCPGVKVFATDDVGKLTAIIGGASLMLTINGAPLHLGVAVQTYTIALLGAVDPGKLLPTSDKFLALKSMSGKIADIAPVTVLEKIWGG
ncbi:MAG: lipopolysaccharide heptosyltransferase family protein [Nostocales cyanobacterium]|nr:MAG: lipopolysaccharide heptosyltransferase family protein [Nostocales cyanobacterium]TAF16638.1 MAG: lipopolysaccharide heptosyltransferase family protein [Nostocales cyanobacterium]